MQPLREDPHRAVILGAGRGGTAMIELLRQEPLVDVAAVVDRNPDAPGMRLARKLGIPTFENIDNALLASAPCVAFNMTGNEMVEAVASEILGAGGVIGGMEARLIWRIMTNLYEAKERLRFEASHDHLTGLYNRRALMDQMRRGVAEALRYGHDYACVMIDVDHFKQVNDRYGHAVGDAVLRQVAQTLSGRLRQSDLIGRWGGEEFLVLLPHTRAADAVLAANAWLECVRAERIVHPGSDELRVSFSAGVGDLEELRGRAAPARPGVDEALEAMLHAADERLYQAKQAGRARCFGPGVGAAKAIEGA